MSVAAASAGPQIAKLTPVSATPQPWEGSPSTNPSSPASVIALA